MQASRHEMGIGSTLNGSWAVLSTADLTGALEITADDIVSYDWPQQTVNLTDSASARLVGFVGPRYPSIGESEKCFVATLNGERLYGGILFHAISAMYIDYPVIYDQWSGGHLQLMIRPAGFTTPYGAWPSAITTRIELPAIRDYFAALGKLTV